MIATLWSSIVQIAVFNWALGNIPVSHSLSGCFVIMKVLTLIPRTYARTIKPINLHAQVPRSFTLLPSSGEQSARKLNFKLVWMISCDEP